MENPTTYSTKHTTVTEQTAEELRAKRSLRVLQHQESRISMLETELAGKSNMLEALQESHSDLMEVRAYQAEVQELQRQLIKLQEIQYLTEVVQPKAHGDINNETKESSTNQQTFRQNVLVHDSKFNSPNYSEAVKNSTGGRSAGTSNSVKNEKSATDNAILLDTQSRMKFGSLKSRLWSMGSLLLNPSKGSFLQFPSPAESNGESKFLACNAIGAEKKHDEQFRMHTQQPCSYDDDDEQISILKETLSSHRQSIEDLSSEVVALRRERSDLLFRVQSLSEWKSKVENVYEDEGTHEHYEDDQNYIPSKTQIGVIMPASSERYSYSDPLIDSEMPFSSSQIKHVRMNLDVIDSNANRVRINEGGEIASQLELRARRMWETTCRFFTPQQAHFILTAPVSYDDDDEL